MSRALRLGPALALLALGAGCSTIGPVALDDPEERAAVLRFLAPAPAAPAAATAPIGSVVRTLVRGVVLVRADQAPTFSGYLEHVAGAGLRVLKNMPSLQDTARFPFHLLFGWIGQIGNGYFGTGFVIGILEEQAYVLTNAHVVGEAPSELRVKLPGRGTDEDDLWRDADLLWIDHDLDAALLRVADVGVGLLEPLRLGRSAGPLHGEPCLAFGFPDRSEKGDPHQPTVTLGIVGSTDVELDPSQRPAGTQRPEGMLQTDAAINSGSSGGPLVDRAGRVVGMNTSKEEDSEGVAYAIPIEWIIEACARALKR